MMYSETVNVIEKYYIIVHLGSKCSHHTQKSEVTYSDLTCNYFL